MGIKRFIAYLLFFCSVCIATNGIAQAQNYHQVQAGETKYGISRQYGISIEALTKANPHIAKGLKAGDRLVIPSAAKSDNQAGKRPDSQPKPASDSTKRHHLVQEGETLYGIARKYKLSITEIKQANPGLADLLKEGQKIQLPHHAQVSPTELALRYYLHTVKKGETLEALSQRYDLIRDSLFLLNPAAEKGLVIGQRLRIPMANYRKAWTDQRGAVRRDSASDTIAQADEPTPPEPDGDPYLLHRVKTGDTFYSLEQNFNVSRQELLRINPELEKGLRPDRYILIPKVPEEPTSWLDRLLRKVEEDGSGEDATLQKQLRDSLNTPRVEQIEEPVVDLDTISVDLERPLRIALMLPFMAGERLDSSGRVPLELPSGTRMSLEFYQGFLMAVDSLARQGAYIRLDVFDTRQNLFRVKRLMDSLQGKSYDLIVGPAFKENVEYVAKETAGQGIPVISPLSRRVDPSVSGNLIQVVPGQSAYHHQLARILDQHFPASQVIFIHGGALSEMEQIKEIISYLQPRATPGYIDNLVVSKEALSSASQLETLWSDSTQKAAVVISENPVFITDVVSKLKALEDSNIFLIGGARLLHMPSLENEYLDALRLTMAEVRYVNWEDQALQDFLRRYRQRYYVEPSEFALQAFDVGWYFLPRLWRAGPYFEESLQGEWQGLSTGFRMKRLEQGGMINQFLFTTGIRSFHLTRLPDVPEIESREKTSERAVESTSGWGD